MTNNQNTKILSSRFSTELFLTVRFGIVGGICTLSHFSMLWVLLSKTTLPIIISNFLAFGVNFIINFFANYIWTFQSPGSPQMAFIRFLVTSLVAFTISNAIIIFMINLTLFNTNLIAAVATFSIPFITFLSSRFWIYKKSA